MANNKTSGSRKNLAAARKPNDGAKETVKNVRNAQKGKNGKNPVGASSVKKPAGGKDMVTLTQAEFDAILGAIGKLTMEKDAAAKAAGGAQAAGHGNIGHMTYTDDTNESQPRARQTRVLISEQPEYIPPPMLEPPDSDDRYPSDAAAAVPWAHMTVAERKRREMQQNDYNGQQERWDPWSEPDARVDRHMSYNNNNAANSSNAVNANTNGHWGGVDTNVPKGPLSISEKKRLQWQKERAEQMHLNGYNPWGKSGSGAPIRDQYGNVVNDFNARKTATRESVDGPFNSNRASTAPDRPYGISQFSAIDPPQGVQGGDSVQQTLYKSRSQPENFNESRQQVSSLPPAAIRSSFAIGAPAPDEDRYANLKEIQSRQWLQELENQMKEQKRRKEEEKRKWKEEDETFNRPAPINQWADKTSSVSGAAIARPPQQPPQIHTAALESVRSDGNDESRWIQSNLQSQHLEMPRNEIPGGNQAKENPGSFLRGQNVAVDAETKRELEEKRRKYLEHQEYLRQQIEERERKKREEKERQLQEDLLEEQKMLQRQQQQPQQQQKSRNPSQPAAQQRPLPEAPVVDQKFTIQQKPPVPAVQTAQQPLHGDKERAERQLADALEAARLQAEREKHERLLQKLKKGNHDVSKLKAAFEGQEQLTARPNLPAAPVENLSVPVVEPTYIPGLLGDGPVSNRTKTLATAVEYMDDVDTGYVENRLITPTVYRTHNQGATTTLRKEFGTQTNLDTNRPPSQQESTAGIEYHPPKSNRTKELAGAGKRGAVVNGRRKSVALAPDEYVNDAHSMKGNAAAAASKQKQMQWNQRLPDRRNVKQSERDLTKSQYNRKVRHLERHQQLMSQMAANSRLVPQGQSSQQQQPYEDVYVESPTKRNLDSVRPGAGTFRLNNEAAPSPQRVRKRTESVSPVRNAGAPRSRSNSVHRPEVLQPRHSSPPIPAVKHKMHHGGARISHGQKIADYDEPDAVGDYYNDGFATPNASVPIGNGFVPFMRTSEVLDPAHAESPLPISREPTVMAKARRAYQRELNPAKYGVPMNHHQNQQKPDRPSSERGRVLQHLSTLRQVLMDKQREFDGVPNQFSPVDMNASDEPVSDRN